MELQPIDTAPKDGTWVLLFGGRTDECDDKRPDCPYRPVVAFFNTEWTFHGDDPAGVWAYCQWDDDWRSHYYDPKYWLPLDALPTPPAKVEG